MSMEEIKRFTKDLEESKSLQAELKENGYEIHAVASFAESKGYSFTADEFKSHLEQAKDELTPEDLEKIAGGSGGLRW